MRKLDIELLKKIAKEFDHKQLRWLPVYNVFRQSGFSFYHSRGLAYIYDHGALDNLIADMEAGGSLNDSLTAFIINIRDYGKLIILHYSFRYH